MAAPTLLAVKTIVVADDTAFVCERFKTALTGAGHKAVTVRTTADLMAHVRDPQLRIDLLLLDFQLPPGHGLELVKTLKRVDTLTAPIVAFSGTIPSADHVRELTGLGVVAYLNEYTAMQHISRALAPHLFPEQHNRRSSRRVALAVPVSYRYGNTIAAALTLNVSHGGLAVRTTNPLPPKTAVKVRFKLPDGGKEVEAEAVVSWVDRLLGMGLEFTSVSDEDKALIEAYVQAHFFSNRKA